MLTGKYKTIQVAWHDDIRRISNVPLATTLDFLTNKFWYKLNKGFGNSNYPKSFDVISRAQILLSSQLNDSVVRKFDELQHQFKQGKLTETQAIATIVELRKLTKKPEEIGFEDVESILETLTEGSIERYLQEQEYLRAKAAREAEENEKLKLHIALKELEMQSKESENLKQSQQNRGLEYSINHNTIEFKEKLLEENVLSKRDLENHKAPIDKLAEKDFNWFRNVLCISAVTYYLVIFYLIYKLIWNVMEPLTYVLGSLPILLSILYLIVFEKNFSPIQQCPVRKLH